MRMHRKENRESFESETAKQNPKAEEQSKSSANDVMSMSDCHLSPKAITIAQVSTLRVVQRWKLFKAKLSLCNWEAHATQQIFYQMEIDSLRSRIVALDKADQIVQLRPKRSYGVNLMAIFIGRELELEGVGSETMPKPTNLHAHMPALHVLRWHISLFWRCAKRRLGKLARVKLGSFSRAFDFAFVAGAAT